MCLAIACKVMVSSLVNFVSVRPLNSSWRFHSSTDNPNNFRESHRRNCEYFEDVAGAQDNPANVLVYDQIADAYLAEGRGEDAAIALAEGMFVTGSASLQEDLLKLYQSVVDNQGCAVIPGAKGPTLNPSCDIVHRDLCAATVRAHRPDLGEQHGCRN